MSTTEDPKISKALVTVAAAIVAVGALASIDVSGTVQVVLDFLLVLTPIAVYVKSNGIDAPYANKAYFALAPAVVGVLSLLGVDASDVIATGGQVLVALTPIIVGLVSNQKSLSEQLLGPE